LALGLHWEREHLGGGHYRHVQYIKRIAYRNAQGLIRRIVTDWEDSQVPGTNHMVMRGPFGVSVSNGGEIRYHPTWEADVGFQVGDPIYRLGGETKHFDLGIPERSGNRLRWLTEHLRMDYIHGGHFGKLGMLFRTDAYQSIDNREIAFPISYSGCERQGRHILIDGEPVMRLRGFVAYDYDDATLENRVNIDHEWRTVGGQEYVIVTLPLAMDGWSRPVLDPTFEDQPDATDGKDTGIYMGEPDTNHGTDATIVTDGDGSNPSRAGLFQFDVSSIPATAIVTAGSFTLYCTNSGSASSIYRILPANDWVESEATWNIRKTGSNWAGGDGDGDSDDGCSVSGTDYDATSMSADPFGSSGSVTADFDSNGVADVQGWIDGTYTNNGIVFSQTYTNGAIFVSSDNATAANRPKLTIEYEEGGVNELWNHPFVHSESFGNPFG